MRERLRELAPSSVRGAAARLRDRGRRASYVRERWPRPLGTRPPVGLAVCAIFRDEARYLAEWVCFHRLQGVERFYLYDNRSSDDWRSELAPEIETGIVEVQHFPFVPAQGRAYQDCLQRHGYDARWIAFIDVDEFLFSPGGRPLAEVLRGFDTHPGVVVSRRTYGTNGFKHPPGGLVIENYQLRAEDDHPGNRWVKSIVNPRSTLGFGSAHHFLLRGHAVGEDRRQVDYVLREPTVELLRINHYYAKSEAEYRHKVERPSATRGVPQDDRDPIPNDAVRDELILQFAPELREMLSGRRVRQDAGASTASR